MAQEYLRVTQEATWGTYAAGGLAAIVQLDQSNQFTMRKKPIPWQIRSAGGWNRRVQTGTQKYQLQGALSTLVYDTQFAVLAPSCFATSSNTLGSVTIDHALVMEPATIGGSRTTIYQRYLGVMMSQVAIAAKESDQLMRLSLQMIGKATATITITDFPEPAATDYPSGNPYCFQHAGQFTLASARDEYEDWNLTIRNILDGRFMRTAGLSRLKYCGRDVDLSIRFPYITAVDRTAVEALSAATATVTFTNGSSSAIFDFKTKNYRMDQTDALDLDKVFMYGISMQNYFDPAATPANDMTVTIV